MNWSFTRRNWDGRARFVVVGALLLMMTAPPVGATSTSASPPIEAREVRTIWTSELGLSHPKGLTYIPESQSFVVVGEGPFGQALLMGPDEEVRGRPQLGSLARPSTLSYDPSTGQMTAFDGQGKLEWRGKSLGQRNDPGRRSQLVTDAVSATYDASVGDLLILTSSGDAIVRFAGGSESRIELAGVADAQLIAANPVDGNIYVMGSNHDLTALDSSGSIVGTFDVSGVALVEPVAMVFAPSSDPTDGAAVMNLFVADSGGAQTLGGVVEVTLTAAPAAASVPIDVGTLVRSTATSVWSPGSPDPAGVVYIAGADNLIVVDSEVDEVTGAGWNNVNMWRTQRTGSVIETGTFWGSNAATYNGKVGFSKEPTGAGFDPGSQILFVSDDSARKIFLVKKGGDSRWGTSDDLVTAVDAAAYGSTDTEDPEFDTASGHMFFLDGVGREIYRINPVDGVFGNGNDVMTHFDISHLGPTDFEGLSSNPARGTLLVGARSAKRVFEITKDGTLLREISVSGISGLRYISGLAYAPSSDNASLKSFYIVDRQVDNGSNSNENDGVLWEVRAPDSLGGGGPQNQAPAVNAGPDLTITLPSGATLNGSASDDGLPSGSVLTVQWSVVNAPSGGVVTFASPNTSTTGASFNVAGTYLLRLTASDTQLTSFDDVSVLVNAAPGGVTEFRAVSQSSVYGTVSGGIENTFAGDGVTQDITEVTNAQGLRAKLEHTWTFNVTGTNRLTFFLKASRIGNEDYKFAYSVTGGSTWKNMVTVQSGTDYQFLLPSGVTGTVIVRVKDVDRTQGDTNRDTLRIDRLVLVPGA